MKIECGNHRVTRLCCQSGQCFSCRQNRPEYEFFVPPEKRERVIQARDVSEETAKHIATNWSRYDAQVEAAT